MAKAKSRGPAAASVKAVPKKQNPFELKKTKTKFNVIGRRTKGSTKNIVQARQDAHNKRKSTLLVEYKALRKANTFKDKRLGEAGGELTEDERALARLAALRVKQDAAKRKKGASKFVLSEATEGEEGGLGLTHMGRSLSEIEDMGEAPPNLDELDDDMVADLVNTYNFGGGEEAGGQRKTRKQVMEEIIAKSKAYKALKAKQKEEDEEELDKLNDEFRLLVQRHSLKALMKPVGFMKGVKLLADSEGDAAYDVAARALAAEARGAAGERTLTPQEMEERERARLEMLEAERLRRMRGAEEDGIEPENATGGYAARRKRIRNKQEGSDDESDEGEDEDEEGEDDDGVGASGGEGDGLESDDEAGVAQAVNALEARRRQQAAGDHPLQDSFRDQAAALLGKYGLKADNPLVKHTRDDDDDDEDDDEGESEEGSEGEGDEGEDGEEEGESGEGEEGGEGVVDGEAGSLQGSEEEGESAEGEDGDEEGEEEEEETENALAKRMLKERVEKSAVNASGLVGEGLTGAARAAAVAAAVAAGLVPKAKHVRLPDAPAAAAAVPAPAAPVNAPPAARGVEAAQGLGDEPMDLPYTIAMPSTYEAFARLVSGRPAPHLALAVRRIRAFNAPALAADAKKQLQVLYGMLVQHFALLAGECPLPRQHLDTLMALILAMTAEVPFYAATVARARLQKMHERLSAALIQSNNHQATTAARDSPWPGSRTFLQLILFTSLFPVSDRRHPVITPLSLLVSKYLTQCTARTVSEAGLGLLLCSVALRMADAGGRYTPEPLNFLTDALLSALPIGTTASHATKSKQRKGSTPASQQQQPGVDEDCTGTGGGNPRVARGLLCLHAVISLKQLKPSLPDLISTLEQAARTSKQQQKPSETDNTDTGGDAAAVAGLLGVVLGMAGRAARGVLAVCKAAAPAALEPLLAALRALGRPGMLPDVLEKQRHSLLLELETACRSAAATRRPLVQAHRTRAPAVKEYIPRFEEEGFSLGRDYDPDRVRAEQKKLKRQLQKEKRGAIRELRRDATFLAVQRDSERAVVDAERMDSQRRFYSELQAQESDMKSGGQRGMNPHLKKKARK